MRFQPPLKFAGTATDLLIPCSSTHLIGASALNSWSY